MLKTLDARSMGADSMEEKAAESARHT